MKLQLINFPGHGLVKNPEMVQIKFGKFIWKSAEFYCSNSTYLFCTLCMVCLDQRKMRISRKFLHFCTVFLGPNFCVITIRDYRKVRNMSDEWWLIWNTCLDGLLRENQFFVVRGPQVDLKCRGCHLRIGEIDKWSESKKET